MLNNLRKVQGFGKISKIRDSQRLTLPGVLGVRLLLAKRQEFFGATRSRRADDNPQICCKKSSGVFSICESHSSTRQTLNAMQMLLSVGLYLM
jgi:hypothetical protein